MDAFWIIPLAIILIPSLWELYTVIQRRSSPPSEPHVLVDKPADKPAIDESTRRRDWQGRPCGSYLDELAGREAPPSPGK